MGEYHFGTGNGKITDSAFKRLDRIARKHGATFTRVTLPGDGPRYWFSCPNLGHPFDGATARAVLDAVDAAGIVLPGRAAS